MEITRLGPGPVGYQEAWDLQRVVHADVVAGRRGDGEGVVLLLEHPPTYTAGKRTADDERPTDGTPVVDVDRGGKITWHGPGQLVGYPIVRLGDSRGTVDVVRYVRRLEDVLVAVCADAGLAAERVEGRSGVWVPADGPGSPGRRPARKVAAIGIRVAQGVTMHGFALNADCDLTAFGGIVPCGIADAGVTSLTAELGRRVGVDDVVPLVERHLAALLSPAAA